MHSRAEFVVKAESEAATKRQRKLRKARDVVKLSSNSHNETGAQSSYFRYFIPLTVIDHLLKMKI